MPTLRPSRPRPHRPEGRLRPRRRLAPGFVAATAMMAVGTAIETGLLPDPAVVPGVDMRESTLRKLRQNGILEPEEEIVYFYSMGMFSFLADGNFFTEARVVSYSDLRGERYYEWAYFEDIVEIGVEFSTTSWDPSVIMINAQPGHAFMLMVSTEGKKDQLFYDALVEAWEEKRSAVRPAGRETAMFDGRFGRPPIPTRVDQGPVACL